MLFSGADYELRAGDYEAVVTEVGARLRALTYRGRPLIVPFEAGELAPFSRGAVLAPWPNRIGDGRYRFGGAEHQLPVNELVTNAAQHGSAQHGSALHGSALHGLVVWEAWRADSVTPSSVVLDHRIWPRPGYPFLVDLRIWYVLGEDGLRITLGAVNEGDGPAPYGCGIHPYFVAGDGPVDGWTLRLPAATVLEVDPVSKLPVRETPVDEVGGVISVTGAGAAVDAAGAAGGGGGLDFRDGRVIGGRRIDNAFGGLERAADGGGSASVTGPDGHGVEVGWDGSCSWVQVFTSDFADAGASRGGLAVEPTTCPPNAFATGTDLITLEPGQPASTTWRISAI